MIQRVVEGKRGWLDAPAAESIARIDAELGYLIQITEAGRDYSRQEYLYHLYLAGKGNLALPPGTSIHEFGRAIDTEAGRDPKVFEVLTRHGWKQTVYRNGVLVEYWHFEYFPENDRMKGETPMAMANLDDSKTWTGQRIGGSLSGDSLTVMIREALENQKTIIENQKWLMNQLGGSNTRKTSLRQDVDKLLS